jgi:putative transposase
MVRQCGLHLVSKMRHDSALFLPYSGKYSGRGLCSKYGKKLNCRALAKKYLKSDVTSDDIRTGMIQVKVWHKLFADMLNVVRFKKTNLKNGQVAHVILFVRSLELAYDKLVEYYQLRFQIEFNGSKCQTILGIRRFYEYQTKTSTQCGQPFYVYGQPFGGYVTKKIGNFWSKY